MADQSSRLNDLFHFIQRMYAEAEDKKLYLRDSTATHDTYRTRKRNLLAANVIQPDRDYYGRFRVLALSDLPADDIVCLVDRFLLRFPSLRDASMGADQSSAGDADEYTPGSQDNHVEAE